jgi:hypothetical protein
LDGPDKKQLPSKAIQFPTVTLITYGNGFPVNNSRMRQKLPKLNKYPATMHVPHPIKRSRHVISGHQAHKVLVLLSSSDGCVVWESSGTNRVGRRLR